MSTPAFSDRDISDESNVALTVNLEEMFDQPVNDESLRLEIAQAIIDKIVDNAKSTKFLDQSSGAQSYSEDYENSLEFNAFGKSPGDVNLTLTGAMLSSIQVFNSEPERVKIAFAGARQSQKAHGHITGNVGVKRDFFGLNARDMGAIIRRYKDRVGSQRELSDEQKQLLSIERRLQTLTGDDNGESENQRANDAPITLRRLEEIFRRRNSGPNR